MISIFISHLYRGLYLRLSGSLFMMSTSCHLSIHREDCIKIVSRLYEVQIEVQKTGLFESTSDKCDFFQIYIIRMWTKASGSNFFGKDFVYTFSEKIGSRWEKMYVLKIVRKFETRKIAHLVLSECDIFRWKHTGSQLSDQNHLHWRMPEHVKMGG